MYAYKKCKLDSSRRGTSGGTESHVQLHFCQYAGPATWTTECVQLSALRDRLTSASASPHLAGVQMAASVFYPTTLT
ncbi:hypothetical protein CgunFtcFv8_023156 [Champsocephalus gunnari]|uniref:Uncharacterized protein n=1 Tax=Champsocephalus gunnari TaxID=52237 RepID=A0AAN8DBU2_CHAGU|nr:hypothetical protein CgunFtcFv8_023156 [Champsocephalus gunnari]